MIEYYIKKTIPALHLACGNDDLRPVMNNVCIRNKTCSATDANMLVHVPADEVFGVEIAAELEGKMIDKESWKTLYELSRRKLGVVIRFDSDRIYMKVNDVSEYVCVVITPENKRWDKFPSWEKIWNEAVLCEHKDTEVIGVNPTFIALAGKAMGIKYSVGMTIKAHNKAILLAPSNDDASNIRAMVMPVAGYYEMPSPHKQITIE